MEKEGIFFSSLMILMIFEAGYYLMDLRRVFSLGTSALTSLLLIGITVGIVSGIQALTFGMNDTSVKLALIASTLISLLFRIEIPLSWFGLIGDGIKFITGTNSLPLGIGLFYPNLTSIFITTGNDILSIFGLIIVGSLMLITVVSGLMIAVG